MYIKKVQPENDSELDSELEESKEKLKVLINELKQYDNII
jgi:hypothetical protein